MELWTQFKASDPEIERLGFGGSFSETPAREIQTRTLGSQQESPPPETPEVNGSEKGSGKGKRGHRALTEQNPTDLGPHRIKPQQIQARPNWAQTDRVRVKPTWTRPTQARQPPPKDNVDLL